MGSDHSTAQRDGIIYYIPTLKNNMLMECEVAGNGQHSETTIDIEECYIANYLLECGELYLVLKTKTKKYVKTCSANVKI